MRRALPSLPLALFLWVVFLTFVPLLWQGEVAAATDRVPNFSIRTWQAEDGLPQNAVTAVEQTQDGYLWIGTYSGLARFDGVSFTVFYDGNTPEMRSSRVTSLFEAGDGTLWIGHEGGELTCFKAGRFRAVETHANWSARAILSIGADETGEIWLVNPEGLLSRLQDGLAYSPRAGSTRGMVNVARTSRTIWVARNGFVSVLRRGQLTLLDFDGQATESYVQGICPGRDGGLWVVSDGLVRKWDGRTWTENLGKWRWGNAPLSAFIETQAGFLAAGTTEQGLYLLFSNGHALHFSRTNGLPSDWVRSLCEDREGNLWVGTAGGLAMLRPSGVETVSPPDQWQGRPLTSVCAGRDGAVWVGTEGAGLYRLKGEQWSRFGLESGLASLFVWSVAEDAQGRAWVGTWGSGVCIQQGERFEVAPGLDLKVPTLALLHAGLGELWVGTSKGLLRCEAGKVAWVEGTGELALPDVRAVVKDNAGTIWFGMLGGGLGCFKSGVVRQFRKADGLTSDFVQCLLVDSDGVLWIGTFGGGLNRLKDGRFAAITVCQGLANNFISWIEDDGQGNFWLGSHAGIMRVSRAELVRCADGEIPSVQCLTYGKGDGLPTPECSGGMQPAGCKTPDGRLWFPTTKGLVVVDPQQVKFNPIAPQVVIEQVRVDGQPVRFNAGTAAPLRIAPGRHRLEFDYTGLSFVVPEKVRFRYRLQGLHTQWVDAGSRRSANFDYVPPGDYTFHVTACNNDGVWNETGAQIAFTVLPHFWQTWPFRVLIGATMVAVASGIVWLDTRRRMRRKIEQLEQQRAIEQERARIARDIHDDLGAYLTRITMLSDPVRNELDGPAQTALNLDRIHKIAYELTQAMDEIVWALNPQHDTLDGLATYLEKFAQDFLGAAGIRCRLELPMQLPPWPLTAEVRHNLFLSFKEALHNVLKHAAASEVRISLMLEPAGFRLAVQDNGRGFVPAASAGDATVTTDRPIPGNGLRNMRRRMADIGGHCEIHSVPAQGTKVTFMVTAKVPAASGERAGDRVYRHARARSVSSGLEQ